MYLIGKFEALNRETALALYSSDSFSEVAITYLGQKLHLVNDAVAAQEMRVSSLVKSFRLHCTIDAALIRTQEVHSVEHLAHPFMIVRYSDQIATVRRL